MIYCNFNLTTLYDTCNKDLFRIDRGQKGLNIYLNSTDISAHLWNTLISKVNTNVSLPKFKSLLKQLFLFNTIEIQYPI